jgi:hypothetical protein
MQKIESRQAEPEKAFRLQAENAMFSALFLHGIVAGARQTPCTVQAVQGALSF